MYKYYIGRKFVCESESPVRFDETKFPAINEVVEKKKPSVRKKDKEEKIDNSEPVQEQVKQEE